MRISDWSSDVCSSDLAHDRRQEMSVSSWVSPFRPPADPIQTKRRPRPGQAHLSAKTGRSSPTRAPELPKRDRDHAPPRAVPTETRTRSTRAPPPPNPCPPPTTSPPPPPQPPPPPCPTAP